MDFVDPKTDIAFKKIFGSSKHKIVLIEFLNTILELEYLIKDVKILNPYQAPKIKGLKESNLDVRATDQKGHEFIVEMQVEKETSFYKRAIYYSSKAYVQQLPKGGKYRRLKPVIFVGILNFNAFKAEEYLSRHLILDNKTQEHSLKDLEFNFIELPKFKKAEEELENLADKWVYFLKEALYLEMVPKSADTEALRQAYEIANQHGWSKKELEIYEYQEIQAHKLENIIETNRREAEEKGRAKGKAEGKAEGKTEGKAEGKTEEKLEIAQNLLAAKADINLISQVTGLSVQEIEKLKAG